MILNNHTFLQRLSYAFVKTTIPIYLQGLAKVSAHSRKSIDANSLSPSHFSSRRQTLVNCSLPESPPSARTLCQPLLSPACRQARCSLPLPSSLPWALLPALLGSQGSKDGTKGATPWTGPHRDTTKHLGVRDPKVLRAGGRDHQKAQSRGGMGRDWERIREESRIGRGEQKVG